MIARPAPDPPVGPLVVAQLCPVCQLPNPPQRSHCRRCGAPLAGPLVTVPRPVLGQIALATGELVRLDRPVVIGRRPSPVRPTHEDAPYLVKVAEACQDVSRSHLGIDLEGWTVLVSDLGSTNGTLLRRPGQAERVLGPGERVVAEIGDVFDIGDDYTITVLDVP